MGVTKFVSSAKLVEYLEQEILDSLNSRGLYDISRYGWLDDDLPDPDYRGIAVWQTGGAVLPDARTMAGLRGHGDRFLAMMRSGLHSLGLAIVFARARGEGLSLFSEEAAGFHCLDAAMKLGGAAMELRDFFMVLHGIAPGTGGRMDPEAYRAPFAVGRDDGPEAVLYARMERLAAGIVDKCQACERLGRALGVASGSPGLPCAGEDGPVGPAGDDGVVDAMVETLCDWHELMIAAGNTVFLMFAALADRRGVDAARAASR